MFARKVAVWQMNEEGERKPCPLQWIDNFAMRNFTNDAIFDDTLPVTDGRMEIGNRVPLEKLESRLQDWFQRKGWLKPWERVVVEELG